MFFYTAYTSRGKC